MVLMQLLIAKYADANLQLWWKMTTFIGLIIRKQVHLKFTFKKNKLQKRKLH